MIHGIFVRLPELAVLILYNAFDKLFYQKPQINGVLCTPANMLQHASCTAEAAEVQFQLKPSMPHYALLTRENVPSLAPTFIISRYHMA